MTLEKLTVMGIKDAMVLKDHQSTLFQRNLEWLKLRRLDYIVEKLRIATINIFTILFLFTLEQSGKIATIHYQLFTT